MEKLIYICVEGKARELMGKCMLASVFLGRGYHVVIGNHSILRRMAAEGVPGVLIDKDFSEIRSIIWEKIHQNGGKIYALDEEGLLYFTEAMYMYRVGESSIKEADGIFLWGENHYSIIQRIEGAEGKLHIVGNPRMDILGKNLDIFYGREGDSYSERHGKYVLVNIGFCVGRGEKEIIGIVEKHSRRKMKAEDKLFLDKSSDNYGKLFDVVCDGIEKMAHKIPNKVIVRPHPSDPSFKRWRDRFAGIKNIEVIRKGDANSWISKAEIVAHTGCTTSLEAYISNKPTVILNPFEELNYPMLSDISVRAESPSELARIVKEYLDTKDRSSFFNKSAEKEIGQFISIEKASYSCERIADVIEENTFSDNFVKVKNSRKLRDYKEELKIIANAMLRKNSQPKFGYTRKEEIKRNIEAGNAVLNQSFKVKVKRLNANVFQCSKA